MKHFQHLFRLFVALIAISTARVVYAQHEALLKIDVIPLDSRFDKLVPSNVKIEKIAGGHKWVEGPVWNCKEGFLLFSDVPNNSIYKWLESKGESLFLKPSGYTGKVPFDGAEPGSNGLAYDPAGNLVLAEHGDRRVARLENDGDKTTLVDRYEGKRINSPTTSCLTPTAICISLIHLLVCPNLSKIRARNCRFKACTDSLGMAS